MFTIEVKKKEKNEEFTFEDLEMFHGECGGGQIKQKPYHTHESEIVCTGLIKPYCKCSYSSSPVVRNFWILTCQRCHISMEIEVEPEFQILEVIATAINGQERHITEKMFGGAVTIVQKI